MSSFNMLWLNSTSQMIVCHLQTDSRDKSCQLQTLAYGQCMRMLLLEELFKGNHGLTYHKHAVIRKLNGVLGICCELINYAVSSK